MLPPPSPHKSTLIASLAAAVVLVVAAMAMALYLTGYMDRTADAGKNFVALVAEGKNYDAYRAAASIVRSRSFESFERAIEFHRLANNGGVTWIGKSKGSGTERKLQGELQGEKKEVRPIIVSLVKESGGWKVFSIESEQQVELLTSSRTARINEEVEEGAPPLEQAVPTEDQAGALVLDTLLKFNEAVQIRYFGPFYQQISETWQNQISPEALQRSFQPFIDGKINIGGVSRSRPVFTTKPQINAEGLLLLTGYCPLDKKRVQFEMRYILERGKWRLFTINLDLIGA